MLRARSAQRYDYSRRANVSSAYFSVDFKHFPPKRNTKLTHSFRDRAERTNVSSVEHFSLPIGGSEYFINIEIREMFVISSCRNS